MKLISKLIVLLTVVFLSSCGKSGDASVKLIPVANGNQFGYIDWDGKIVINPQFAEANLFKDGMALIKTSGKESQYGYIDTKGTYIINPQYLYATDFEDGIALTVKTNEYPKGINPKGEVVFEIKNAQSVKNFSEGLAAYSIESVEGVKWGFIDNKGTTIITPQFFDVGKYSDGKCAVCNKDGKWGYIDKMGKILINNQFTNAGIFKNGNAVIYDTSGKAGLIDDTGKYLINPQFQQMIPDGNKFLVESGGKMGWTDSKGTIIINPQFDGAFPFGSNNTASVRQGDSWGYIDDEGKFIINPQFSIAYPFISNKAIVGNSTDYGIIDKKGNYLVNPQFSGLSGSYREFVYSRNNQTVISDYFDAESIANAIKKEITPETVNGFNFSTPLSQLMAKYPQHKLNYYYGNSFLFQNQEINKYANLSLAVEGTIYIQSGWNYVPNPNATVDAFIYVISSQGKAYGKTEEILKSLENGFNGFQKVQNPTGGRFQFTSNKLLVTIGLSGGNIVARISPNINSSTEVVEPLAEEVVYETIVE